MFGSVLFRLGLWMVAVSMGAQTMASAPVPDGQTAPPRIGIADFRQMATTALIVDVRSASVFALGHIPGAVNVPYPDIDRRAADLAKLANGKPIVTYCSCPSDHASAEAAASLIARGVPRVQVLAGGFPAWVQAGGAVDRP